VGGAVELLAGAGHRVREGDALLFRELGELGYTFIFITPYALHAGTYAAWNAFEDLVKNQEQARWTLEKTKAGHPTESHHIMARVSDFQALEKRFIPGSEDRIKRSHGFDDQRAH
jgi:isocitrate lyase